MNTQQEFFDPVQKPETATPKKKNVETEHGTFRSRLRRYGNHILQAAQHFNHVLLETVSNMATALAGTIIMLPVVIVIRFVQVALDTIFNSIKPLILSLLRAFIDGLRVVISPIHRAFRWYNKDVLKPLLKQIREDDIAALFAFGILMVIVIMMVMTLLSVF
jgi:hypothetical protein